MAGWLGGWMAGWLEVAGGVDSYQLGGGDGLAGPGATSRGQRRDTFTTQWLTVYLAAAVNCEGSCHGEFDSRMAGAAVQPDVVDVVSLVQNVPMHHAPVVGIAVDAGLHLDPSLKVHRRDLAANGQYVGIGQAGEALETQVHSVAGPAAPAHIAAEHATVQVEPALVLQHLAPVHAELLAGHEHDQRQPVGTVSQFRVEDRDVVVHAVDQSSRPGTGIPFLESAPRAQVAVAEGERGFLVVQASRIKFGFADRPAGFVHDSCCVLRLASYVLRLAPDT